MPFPILSALLNIEKKAKIIHCLFTIRIRNGYAYSDHNGITVVILFDIKNTLYINVK